MMVAMGLRTRFLLLSAVSTLTSYDDNAQTSLGLDFLALVDWG